MRVRHNAPELVDARGVDVRLVARRVEDVLAVVELHVLELECGHALLQWRGGRRERRTEMTDGRGLGRRIGELPAHEAHVVGLHHHHELRMDQVDTVHLATPMPAKVRVRQLGEPRQRRPGAQSHGLPVDGVRPGGDDMERVPGTTVAKGVEHEPRHDRPRRVAGAQHQEVGHREWRSRARASASRACCA